MCNDHKAEIDYVHDALVKACVNADLECLPVQCQPAEPQNRVIPGWNDHVREAREQAIFWHSLWKNAGSPCNGVVADIRRTTRARYHLAIKRLKQHNIAQTQTRFAEVQ
jgi:hypothetical protein